MKRISHLFLFPIVLGAAFGDHPSISLEQGGAGAIITTSATAPPQGTWGYSVQYQMLWFDEIPDAELARYSELHENVHSLERVTAMSIRSLYAVTDETSVGFSLPYIWRSGLREASHHHGEEHSPGHSEEPAVENVGDADGLGDLVLYGKYQFYHNEAEKLRLALIGGLKTPTGRTDARTISGELFEAEHQPGSGSWDPLIGAALTQQVGKWCIDANFLFTLSTEGTQDTVIGDVFAYNFAVSRRILGGNEGEENHAKGKPAHDSHKDTATEAGHGHHHAPIWDLVLELNGGWRDRVRISDIQEPNTGENIIYLAAGQRFAWGDGWSATMSVGVPAFVHLDGIQCRPVATTQLGLSKAF